MRIIPRRPALLCLLLALLASLPLSAGALAARAPAGFVARPATQLRLSSRDAAWDARPTDKLAGRADGLVSVIVKLQDAPLASYAGGLPGLPATAPQHSQSARLDISAPASRQYLRYLDQRQAAFAARAQAAIPQARLAARYRTVFGGVAMIVPADQVARLAALPGALWVQRDQLRQADTDRSPRFIGADVIWRALAANPSLGDGGQGVIVGVIDTGIWPEHPSFADDGSYPPPPARWHGACERPADSSPPIACSNKLIGARSSLAIYKFFIGLSPGEFDSPRDNEGHGTHTASTAAGNAGVAASVLGQPRGLVSGIAPRAYVAAYKALGNAGGFSSDIVAAIDQAVADGVDIINYSIGSADAPDPYQTADALAFLDAYRAGVFVAVSAGNHGPEPGTVSSPANAPWVMSVAASTLDRSFVGRLTLHAGADTLTLSGASLTGALAGRPVVDAGSLGVPLCDGPLPAAARGAIVICRRGVNARVEKGKLVRDSGGVGMLLYNPTPQDVVSDSHWLPTLHIDAPAADQLLAFMRAHAGATVLGDLAAGQPVVDPALGDIVAAFSSRGPLATSQLGISKPDVAAPGVQILAGHTPAPNLPASGPRGELFQAIAGTSMAAPHVAGAGALLKALHPSWTPGQIKSALMTTAWTNLRDSDGFTPASPYAVGAGRIDLRYAGDPGLTLDVTADQFARGSADLTRLNYPSISIAAMPGRISVARTVTSVLDQPSQWALSAEAPAGVQITLDPPTLRVPARGSATFTVTLDAGAALPGPYFGRVLLQSGERRLHLPVSFVRAQAPVALEQRCDPDLIVRRATMQCAIVVTNNGLRDTSVRLRSQIAPGLALLAGTLSGASYDSATQQISYAGPLAGFRPATIVVTRTQTSLPAGYVPLASLGIAPSACGYICDEAAISFATPQFSYGGQQYDRVTMVSNGYLIVGDHSEISLANEALPDPSLPNTMIAPYWADLDLLGKAAGDTGGGSWSAAIVSDRAGATSWFVAEWTDVARYGRDPAASHHTFQIWIEAGSDRIQIVYGPNSPTEDRLTVGAENADGTAGSSYYFDGTTGDGPNGSGPPPAAGEQLSVVALPEQRSAHTITLTLRGSRVGSYQQTAELTASSFDGVNVSVLPISVFARAPLRLFMPGLTSAGPSPLEGE